MEHGEPSTQACGFASCFTFENLMDAAAECRRSSAWKRQVQAFMSRRATECRKLEKELASGSYNPTAADRFSIMERGKPREVKSIKFRDRVVQRCLCDHILVPAVAEAIGPNASACLVGRGLSYAYREVRRITGDAPTGAWVLQFDFAGYFASIDHGKLLAAIRPLMPDGRTFGLLEAIIAEEEAGLELGSHVSQICAAYYPHRLDVAIEGVPGCIGYHRYMDDGVAVFDTRDHAAAGMRILRDAAESLGLSLNEAKTHLNRVASPFVFCKMRFEKKPGRVKMNVVKRQSRRSARHYRSVASVAEARGIDMTPVRASAVGYLNRGDADLTRLVD